MANLSLYDLAVLQRNDPYTGLIEDVTTYAPEFTTLPAHKRSGWWYEAAQRVALPTVGFRAANEDVATSRSTFKKTVKEMLFIDCELQLPSVPHGNWSLRALSNQRPSSSDSSSTTVSVLTPRASSGFARSCQGW